MKVLRIFPIGVLALLLGGNSLQGAIASWSFDATASNPFNATSASGFSLAQLNVTTLSGGTVSYDDADGNPPGSMFVNKGQNLEFRFTPTGSTADFTSLNFDYQRLGATSPTSVTWTYSLTSGPSGSISGSTAMSGILSWSSASSVDLSPVPSLAPSDTLLIQGVLGGGSGGILYLDNFSFDGTLTPIPEPIHYAMGIFGLIVGGVGVTRRWLAARKS